LKYVNVIVLERMEERQDETQRDEGAGRYSRKVWKRVRKRAAFC